MTRGRPTRGPQMALELDASRQARERLELMLETISGITSVTTASERLGISEARFYELRDRALTAAVQSLEPLPAGRPRTITDPGDARVDEMEAKLHELTVQLEASRLREQIALTMPHLLVKEARRRFHEVRSSRALRPITRGGKGGTSNS